MFMPVDSVQDLEELAGDYILQKKLNITSVAAGIVFDGLPSTTTSDFKTASVYIRMNQTYVHDTTLVRET